MENELRALRTHLDRARRQGRGPRRQPRRPRRHAPGRHPAAADPLGRRGSRPLPHHGQRRLGAPRPVRHHPHRRPSGHDRGRATSHATGRYRRALERQADFDLDLSTGVPDDDLLPNLEHALDRLTTAGTPGGYLDEPVLPELMRLLRGDWPYDAEELTVVDGAMDALDLVARSLVRFGDRVVVEHPCFPPLLDLLESIGADVVGVPMDDEGLIPGALAAAIASPTAAVFVQPRAQNPTGVSLTTSRAAELAAVLAATGVPVVEDDSAGAISIAPDLSLGRWIPGQTVHVRSYSKSHGPDLRLAALGGPTELLRDALARRQLGQGWSSRLLQRILVGLLTDDEAVAHVGRARQEYARRRGAMVTALGATASTCAARTGSTSGCRCTTRPRRSCDWPARASA